jgi:hypothetical protein
VQNIIANWGNRHTAAIDQKKASPWWPAFSGFAAANRF